MDRRALFASAVAATVLAASGVSAGSLPRRGGRLRMALSGAARDDTWTKGQGLFMQVARQGVVFDTLTEVAANGTLQGELATGWQSSADARLWRFELRGDVLFHDGAQFTSADVVASASGFDGGEVFADGPQAVCFALHAPDPSLPLRLARPEFFISPAHAIGAGIGTGLYRVKTFSPGQQLLAERVADHYKGDNAGWFDTVELVSIPSCDVRAEALGGYLVDAIDTDDATAIAALPDARLFPDVHAPFQAMSGDLSMPAQLGTRYPLDDLRAAERWWFA